MGERTLELHLSLEPGEPLSGRIRADPDAPAIVFSGWLGLAEALQVLREASGGPPGARGG